MRAGDARKRARLTPTLDCTRRMDFLPLLLMALPFIVLLGLPWLLIAWIWWRLSSKRVPDLLRATIAAFISSCGLAPYLYGHGAAPIYIILFSGDPLPPNALPSFVVTFVILFSLITLATRRRNDGAI